jgi:hypothetical protein
MSYTRHLGFLAILKRALRCAVSNLFSMEIRVTQSVSGFGAGAGLYRLSGKKAGGADFLFLHAQNRKTFT